MGASLGGTCAGAPAVARVPPNERLSFLNVFPIAKEDEDQETQRLLSMKRACEEAHLREQAVEVYEKGKQTPASDELPPLGVEASMPLFPRQGASVPSQNHSSRCRFPVAPLPKTAICNGESQVMHPGMSISRLTSGIPSAAPRIQKV